MFEGNALLLFVITYKNVGLWLPQHDIMVHNSYFTFRKLTPRGYSGIYEYSFRDVVSNALILMFTSKWVLLVYFLRVMVFRMISSEWSRTTVSERLTGTRKWRWSESDFPMDNWGQDQAKPLKTVGEWLLSRWCNKFFEFIDICGNQCTGTITRTSFINPVK